MSLRTTGLGKTIPEGGGHPPGLELRAGPSWSELPQLPHRSNPVTTTSEMCGFSSFLWCSPGTAPHLRQASHLNILFRESPGAAVSWSGHSGARGPQAGSAWELTSLEPGRPSPAPHHSDISTLCSCAGRTPWVLGKEFGGQKAPLEKKDGTPRWQKASFQDFPLQQLSSSGARPYRWCLGGHT